MVGSFAERKCILMGGSGSAEIGTLFGFINPCGLLDDPLSILMSVFCGQQLFTPDFSRFTGFHYRANISNILATSGGNIHFLCTGIPSNCDTFL